MNYVILDLEATCWRDRSMNKQNEIIEIGAVKFDNEGHLIDEFSEFVKPKLNPILSDFCTALTSIEQKDIDLARPFNQVIQEFQDWIKVEEPYFLGSWGFYDKKQFAQDCELYRLDQAWLKNHFSLKHQYAELNNLRKPLGMGGALKREKLKLDGTHHRGIDDARNISKIFKAYFGKWTVNFSD